MAVIKYKDEQGNWQPLELVKVTASSLPIYKGSYEVIPSTYNVQTLETAMKRMSNDVEVQKIPQFEVENANGGNTLIIGEEYYQ